MTRPPDVLRYSIHNQSHHELLQVKNRDYVFDDSIMVAIKVITLSHRKLQVSPGHWLKLFSALVIGLLGGMRVFAPELLR